MHSTRSAASRRDRLTRAKRVAVLRCRPPRPGALARARNEAQHSSHDGVVVAVEVDEVDEVSLPPPQTHAARHQSRSLTGPHPATQAQCARRAGYKFTGTHMSIHVKNALVRPDRATAARRTMQPAELALRTILAGCRNRLS
eukprot:COSAG06_NODE_18700_length_872_cov_5.816300_1_plen_141_part_01